MEWIRIRTVIIASKRDTCSWKGQLERTRSWKIISWKVQNEIGKIEVGKFEPKLESSWRSWEVRDEVGRLGLKLESDL